MKNILILTHQNGVEADLILKNLKEKDCKVVRFNTDDGDNISKVTYYFSDRIQKVLLECDNEKIDLHDVDTAWFQQPFPFDIESVDFIKSLQRGNLSAALLEIEQFIHGKWINKPSNTIQASNKIEQLKLAQKNDLHIPKTLISNNPEEIKSFCMRNEAIVKNLNTPWFTDENDDFFAAYTKEVHPDMLEDDKALQFTPLIYQEKINKKQEVRVVTIGDSFFALGLKPSDNDVDIRHELIENDDTSTPINMPENEIEKLKKLKKDLGIEMAGVDYLIDESGNWVFLELNTCGAWWWVDKYFDGQIQEKITEELLKEK